MTEDKLENNSLAILSCSVSDPIDGFPLPVFPGFRKLGHETSLSLSLLVMGLTSAGGAAQTALYLDEPYALPVINTGSSSIDHVVVAVNPLGDVLVVFHENVSPAACGSTSTSQVTAVFIPKAIGSNGAEWLIPSSAELVGAPCAGDGGNRTRCEKPQVAAVGDNNHFVILYSRDRVTDTPTTSRLEALAVQVTVNTSGYNSATYRYPLNYPGEGYVVSDGLFGSGYQEGDSGGNVGVGHFTAGGLPDDDGALAVFLDQPGSSGLYRLYAVYVDFTLNGISGVPAETPLPLTTENTSVEWLVEEILSEGHGTYGDAKNVAPFILEDDNGFLVLAVDEWDAAATNVGWIRIRSYTYAGGTTSLTLEDALDFQGSNTSWHHRRPVLARTLLDSSDALGLSWSNYLNDSTDPDIDWRRIEVDETTTTTSAFGEISQISDYGPSMTNVEHARAILAYKGGGTPSTFEAVLYRDRSTTPDSIEYWDGTSYINVDEATGTDNTNRPAYAVWNNGSEHYLIVVWDQLVSGQPRPFIKIAQIG